MTYSRNTLYLFSLLFYFANAQSDLIVGITSDTRRVVIFNSSNPSAVFVGPEISQIPANQTIRSADYRPSTGQLYVIATTAPMGGSQMAQLYILRTDDGTAAPIGFPFTLNSGSTQVHIDFNPSVDRIRLVTGDNLNLRLNPNDGSVAATDGNLAYSSSDVNAGSIPMVANIAYSNNVPGGTPTTLYAIETGRNVLATIGSVNSSPVSPNSGMLFTVNSLSRRLTAPLGFDISATTGIAYVSDAAGIIYTINLASGALGVIGTTSQNLLDISVFIDPRTFSTPCANNGDQRCVSNNSYITCTNGFTSQPQFCQPGFVCSSSGNKIYCVPRQSSTTGRAATTGAATPSTTGAIPSTTGGSVVGTPCNSSGDQRCVGTNTYSTCTNGFYSQTQTCQPNLTCKPSGRYIYCS